MPNKHVVIVGNVGTGKTTLLQTLSEYSTIRVLPADELFRTNPFFPLSKQDPQRWVLTNDLWFLLKRFEMIKAELAHLKKKHLVIDSGILMSYVYGSAHAHGEQTMSEEEWKLFEECFNEWFSQVSQPDLVIFLDAPFETLRGRIEQRNRGYEVDTYFKYLNSITVGLSALEEKIHTLHIPALHIHTEQLSPKEVAEEVYSAIES